MTVIHSSRAPFRARVDFSEIASPVDSLIKFEGGHSIGLWIGRYGTWVARVRFGIGHFPRLHDVRPALKRTAEGYFGIFFHVPSSWHTYPLTSAPVG